ncbi:MAG: sugar phosphate isomerase/epimerase [Rhodopirellula sp.]|nr:sugar phosphate isomerase/epimerase [Rhodopirellula sp.]
MSTFGGSSSMHRRDFLQWASVAAGSVLLAAGAPAGEQQPGKQLQLATNQYPWFTFYRRENRDFAASLDDSLREVAASGMDGFEPLVTDPAQLDALVPLLARHNLQMRSLYVNSTLHLPDAAEKSIESVLAIAEKAKQAGTQIVVTNPNPVRWGSQDDKDDAQLRFQAAALNTLGEKLAVLGLMLAYHNHDAELRNAAREFHHMMVGTDARFVTLCLDAHWIYRGSGNSAVAVMDVARLYGPRIRELHLRQSAGGIWTETFGDGDIDYADLAEYLAQIGAKPLVVLEQAVEKDTPKTLGAVEAHRRGGQYARKIFASWAG